MLTVGASAALSELCPDNDLSRLGELFETTDYFKQINTVVQFLSIMSKGYEEHMYYSNADYKQNPLTEGELMSLPMDKLKDLQALAFAAFKDDTTPTVETEPAKKARAKKG